MAKSKDSTSPSSLTRRTLLAGAAAAPLAPAPVFSESLTGGCERDPVLALWQQWREAQAEAEAWRVRWQKLERLLFRTVGFPRVAVPAPGDRATYVIDHDDIEDLLGDAAETAALRERLHANLASHQARWDAAATSVQFAAVEVQYDAADVRAEALSDTISRTPAGSVAGVAAKLALVVAFGQPSEHDDQFPWPHLRSALADLHRLAASPSFR